MSDEILHQGPTGPAPEPAEVAQPSTEATEVAADGTGAPAQEVAETEAQAAERIVQERKVRQERARRNQEAAFQRLAKERDEYRQIALEAARNRVAPQAPAPAEEGPPSRDKYERWEDYEAALVAYQVDQKLSAHQKKQAAEVAAAMERIQREQHQQTLIQSHAARNAEFAKQVPDFDEVTARDDIEISEAASESIMSVPNGPAVLYEIGRQPELAERMARMTPYQQAAFVGQISASLMARTPQVSKAPAPGTPVGGKSPAPTRLEDLPYDEFVKARRKQIAARNR